MFKKQISTGVGILIIFILVGVVGMTALFFNQKSNEKVDSEQYSVIEQNKVTEINKENTFETNGLDDWNTYRNEEMGFEFKFPKDWFKGKCGKSDGATGKEIEMADCISIADPVIERKQEMELGGPGFMSNFSLQIEKPINYGVKNIDEFIDLLASDNRDRIVPDVSWIDETKFLGKDAYVVSPIGHAGAEGILLVFEENNYLYTFIFGEYYENSHIEFEFELEKNFILKNPEIVGKILSTFKFIN